MPAKRKEKLGVLEGVRANGPVRDDLEDPAVFLAVPPGCPELRHKLLPLLGQFFGGFDLDNQGPSPPGTLGFRAVGDADIQCVGPRFSGAVLPGNPDGLDFVFEDIGVKLEENKAVSLKGGFEAVWTNALLAGENPVTFL